MSTILFAAFEILAPMHGFLRRFTFAKIPAARINSPRLNASLPYRPDELLCKPMAEPAFCARARVNTRSRSRANPPLRVIRVMESGQAPAHGGRMVISGRMADVCAELDRMAEREASQHTGV